MPMAAVALGLEHAALGDEAAAVQRDLGGQAELLVLLDEGDRLGPGVEAVHRLGPRPLDPGQVGLEVVGGAEGGQLGPGHLAAGRLEGLLEAGGGLLAGGVVGRGQEHRAVLDLAGHVLAEGPGDLPVGERGPPDVVGALLAGDGVGPGVGDDERDLAVGDQVAHAQRHRRVHDADQGGHLVLLEQLLGRGHARLRPAALVGHHHLDVAPAQLAAVRLQVQPEAVLHVPAQRRVHPRLGDQQPHLDRAVGRALLVLLQARPAAGDQGDGQGGGDDGHETTGEASAWTLPSSQALAPAVDQPVSQVAR